MRFPTITGHSGCEGAPRDSMESIERALAKGADVVEMDVRCAPDGVLCVSHDPLSGAEYAARPTLEDVFLRIRDTRLALNCDMKEPSIVGDILAMAARYGFGPERLYLSGSASPEQLACDPSITAGAQVWLNIEQVLKVFFFARLAERGELRRFPELMQEPWRFLHGTERTGAEMAEALELTQALGVRGVNLPYALLTDQFAQQMNSRKIPFSVWTVNDAGDMARCFALGAENVTTLAVELAVRQRRQTPGR